MTDLLLRLLTSAFIFSSLSLLRSKEFKPCSKLCNASSASLSLFSSSMRTFTSAWGRRKEQMLLKTACVSVSLLQLNRFARDPMKDWQSGKPIEIRQNLFIGSSDRTKSTDISAILLYSDFPFHSCPLILWTTRSQTVLQHLNSYLWKNLNKNRTSFHPK